LPLTLVPASLSKGLEFDAVVLVAPEEIVAAGPHGRRALYVAMTRCTQQLHILHGAGLPAGLEHLEIAVAGFDERGELDDSEPTLEQLVGRLSDADRQLVEALVLRLLPAEREGS
jgi:hypothetical protein